MNVYLKLSLFIIILFGHTLNLRAELPKRIENIKCKKHLIEKLHQAKSRDIWSRTSDQEKNTNYRSPTRIIGKWVEIKAGLAPSLLIYTKDKIQITEWEPKKCKIILNNYYPSFPFIKKNTTGLSDKLLKKIINQKKISLIYITNDLNQKQRKEQIKKISHDKKVSFYSSHINFTNYNSNKDSLVFNTLELIMRNSTHSYPAIFLIGNKKISQKINANLAHTDLVKKISNELHRIKRKY